VKPVETDAKNTRLRKVKLLIIEANQPQHGSQRICHAIAIKRNLAA
jgi:hypothetical protein